jgi:hypothetical protein
LRFYIAKYKLLTLTKRRSFIQVPSGRCTASSSSSTLDDNPLGISYDSPGQLPPAKNPHRGHPNHGQELQEAARRYVTFFEINIRIDGATTQPCYLHVLLELVGTDTTDADANDATVVDDVPNHERKPAAQPNLDVPSQRILKFRTGTPAVSASFGTEYSAAVSKARNLQDQVTNEINGVSGTITLDPLPVSVCTRVTLEVSIYTRAGAAKIMSLSSSSGLLGRKSMASGFLSSSLSARNNSTVPSAENILNHFTAAVPSLHHRYARYDEVDEATLNYFETVAVPSAPLSYQA